MEVLEICDILPMARQRYFVLAALKGLVAHCKPAEVYSNKSQKWPISALPVLIYRLPQKINSTRGIT
jgi:hypothetical protein